MAQLTKKHYNLLASIMRAHVAAEQLAGSELGREYQLVLSLSILLKHNNERFDPARFVEACGL
jgi:hypothetical protein